MAVAAITWGVVGCADDTPGASGSVSGTMRFMIKNMVKICEVGDSACEISLDTNMDACMEAADWASVEQTDFQSEAFQQFLVRFQRCVKAAAR